MSVLIGVNRQCNLEMKPHIVYAKHIYNTGNGFITAEVLVHFCCTMLSFSL